jgi:nitroreductase
MELIETLRTTGAVREFTADAIDDETVYRILETARFAPSGGNRQGWRVILIKDPERRRRLRDLYLEGWYEYLAQTMAGLVPWAPLTDEEAERQAIGRAPELAEQAAAGPGGFAEHLESVPVLLLLLADLSALAALDKDLARYTFVGGASLYPFAWSIQLAARAEGMGGVITTMPVRRESAVRDLFDIPADFALAGLLALGRPVRQATWLGRNEVASFTTVDTFAGPQFSAPGTASNGGS